MVEQADWTTKWRLLFNVLSNVLHRSSVFVNIHAKKKITGNEIIWRNSGLLPGVLLLLPEQILSQTIPLGNHFDPNGMFTCFACDQEQAQQDGETRIRAVPLKKKRRQAHLSPKNSHSAWTWVEKKRL